MNGDYPHNIYESNVKKLKVTLPSGLVQILEVRDWEQWTPLAGIPDSVFMRSVCATTLRDAESTFTTNQAFSRRTWLLMLKAVAGDQKIAAIKMYRDVTHYGLKESKEFVEWLLTAPDSELY